MDVPGVQKLFNLARDAEARRQGISEVGYGIRDTWVDPAEAVPEIAPMTVGEVNTRVTELAELHERDTQDLYALLEDAQDVIPGRVLVTPGSVVVPPGSVVVTTGSVVVPPGSVVVPPGSVVVPPGSVITTGSYNLFSKSDPTIMTH
ncbi:hypothetical protein Tco_0969992 [Tanacetum coccineum]